MQTLLRAASSALCAICLSMAAGGQSSRRPDTLADLPITEMPAAGGETLAVFWSGDGGWAALVSSVSKELVAKDIAVIGINARSWMEQAPRTPDAVAFDTERILRTYLTQWSRSRILLLGYSRGANFLPFIVNRLPPDLRERVVLAGMLGAAQSASFEFHLLDLVRNSKRSTDILMLPEIMKSTDVRYLCLHGAGEAESLCPQLDRSRVTIVMRPGDHHFDRNYAEIAADIVNAIPARGTRSR